MRRRFKNYENRLIKLQNKSNSLTAILTVINIIVIIILGISNFYLISNGQINDAQLKQDSINQTDEMKNHQMCLEQPRIYIGEPFGINTSKNHLSGLNIPFVTYNNPSQITSIEIYLNDIRFNTKPNKIFNKNEYGNILIISDKSFDFSKYISEKTIILYANLDNSIDGNLNNNILLIKTTYDGFTQNYRYRTNRMFYISLNDGLSVISNSTDVYIDNPAYVDVYGNIFWVSGKTVCG